MTYYCVDDDLCPHEMSFLLVRVACTRGVDQYQGIESRTHIRLPVKRTGNGIRPLVGHSNEKQKEVCVCSFLKASNVPMYTILTGQDRGHIVSACTCTCMPCSSIMSTSRRCIGDLINKMQSRMNVVPWRKHAHGTNQDQCHHTQTALGWFCRMVLLVSREPLDHTPGSM